MRVPPQIIQNCLESMGKTYGLGFPYLRTPLKKTQNDMETRMNKLWWYEPTNIGTGKNMWLKWNWGMASTGAWQHWLYHDSSTHTHKESAQPSTTKYACIKIFSENGYPDCRRAFESWTSPFFPRKSTTSCGYHHHPLDFELPSPPRISI